jgi:dolichyl-diphosphooligosaccharide--protein glycosyltransferase
MSRSVAGSYDNEGVSIFALVFTFYVFIKACNTGSILWSVGSALSYFYMVASWGGYSFIINIIPIFVLFTLITHKDEEADKFRKITTAYNIFYILGTLLAMQIPFVQFLALTSSEHMASHGVFIILQFYQFSQFIKKYIGEEKLKTLFRFAIIGLSIALGAGFILLLLLGQTKWSGRSMTLLDPTYAKKYIPIVASVSEHQATTWSSYFFDIHFAIFFAPVGLYYIYRNRDHNIVFIGIYAVLSVYFASVMIRLLLVFAPAACICAAIGISWLYDKCI